MKFLDDIDRNLALAPPFLQKYAPWLETPLFVLGDSPITIRTLLQFILIVFIAYVIASLARKSLKRLAQTQTNIPQKVAHNLSRFVFYFIFILGLLFAMSSVGLNFTSIAVVAGALSVGIGFGFQSIVQNIIAGLFLLMEKHIRVGHIIGLESGAKGKVVAIRLRTTVLKSFDNIAILVPNAELISQKVTNFSLLKEKRRLMLPFSVAFGTDKKKLSEILIQEAKKIPYTAANTKPEVWMSKIGDNGLEFELIVLIDLKEGVFVGAVKSLYLNMIEDTLVQNKITIPYPVRDVRIQK